MTIDRPIEQAEMLVAGDRRQATPRGLMTAARALSELLTVAGPTGEVISAMLSRALDFSDRQEEENQRYLLSVAIEELKYLQLQVGQLKDEQKEFLNTEGIGLLAEAAKRASETRDRDRIRRIAAVFAHGVENAGAVAIPEAEEFMRLAVLLSDTDVLVLREFVRRQAGLEERARKLGRTLREEANWAWRENKPVFDGLSEGDLQSACSRLQAFGLVVRVDRIDTALGVNEIPYALVRLGEHFAEYITSYNNDDGRVIAR
jgi:hypothetical protein